MTAPLKVVRHYYWDKSSNIIYYSKEIPEDSLGLTHVGTSDNPNPKSAVQSFLQKGKVRVGFKVRNLDED